MGKQGQPEISHFVKLTIAYKVIQYKKRYNLTLRASWLKLTEHKAFKDLMQQNFSNKVHSQYWVNNILSSDDVKVNFYNHHIKKIIAEFPKLKVYTPTEYKAYLVKIRTNKTKGIGSLKNTLKRVRKP